MFPAWFELTSSEKDFPVSWYYLFKAWIYCGLLFVRKKKRGARYKLNCLWSKFWVFVFSGFVFFFWMCIFGTNVLQLQAAEEHLVWWVRFNKCNYLISYTELLILLILLNSILPSVFKFFHRVYSQLQQHSEEIRDMGQNLDPACWKVGEAWCLCQKSAHKAHKQVNQG